MRYAMQGDYVIWIMVSTIGLLQALASFYGWAGLSFFRGHLRLGYLCGATLVPFSYFWFFSSASRDVPGLEGWQLFSRFGLGALAGVLAVLILSSIVNASMRRGAANALTGNQPAGLDALREDTWFHLLQTALSERWAAGGLEWLERGNQQGG
jgi:hypothetical protein